MFEKTYLISYKKSAREALRQLNEIGTLEAVLFIYDEHYNIIGSLADGDIRRGLLQFLQIDEPVSLFMNRNFHYCIENISNDQLIKLKSLDIRYIPILDKNKKLIKIADISIFRTVLGIDVAIIAGGRGERLKPLTDTVPKPLLKIGERPILEHTIDRLISFGISNFHISIGYLGHFIKNYFGNGKQKNISIKYLSESKPLGTVGALSLIKNMNSDVLLFMNSDLLTNIDFADFYETFNKSNADFAVATIPYNINVPYAVMEIDKNNQVSSFKEKPIYTYYSNAGIYLIKKKLLKHIPKNEKFDATTLMNKLIEKKYKIISYPIIGYWLDIGRMDDFIKAQQDIKLINF